jgi:NAD(P)H-quinone oxidoreductase subunit 4
MDQVLDMETLSKQSYPLSLCILLYLGFLLAFAVKYQLFLFIPGYQILTERHIIAPVCLLAGILLKMGGYGFIE